MVGFKSHEKLGQCRVWTKWQNKGIWQSFRENIIPINVEYVDDATLRLLIDTVRNKHVLSLRGYASWYKALCEYLIDGKGDPRDLSSLRICISHSEALDERARILFEEMVGCKIVECYATEETGVLGQQRIDTLNYTLNHAGYIFEVLEFDSDTPVAYGQMGRLVVTDLFNYAFPLIRYEVSDAVILQGGDLDSGGWPLISKIYGRLLDMVYDTKGTPVHPMTFARVFKNYAGIVQWQFVQTDAKSYLVKLCLREGVTNEQEISNQIKEIMGADALITFEQVDDIPVLQSGKKKSVVRQWQNI
jgi:phenylacetate-CoA ligase